MTMKLNAGDVTRSDEFLIDPQEIIVDQSLNGRRYPHGAPEVSALAHSYESEGQIQAVQVRRVQDNRVQLILGYRRHAAALLYNDSHPDQPMKLKCKVVSVNSEEAFRRNIVENRERSECTPIDDAHNQRRLREEFAWTDGWIAEFYQMSPGYVSSLKKLLLLPSSAQEMIHSRTLSVQAALALADLPDSEVKEVLQTVKEEQQGKGEEESSAPVNGKSNSTNKKVIAKVRDKQIDNGVGKSTSRSMKEVREFLEGMTGPAESAECKALAENLLKFIQGKLKDATMEKKFREAFGK